MPFSANFDTKLWFDHAFVQKSVRGLPSADAEKVALDEHLLTLLLHHYPHNYSE
jgi:hypothetical protein